jgi:hypothetical protein
VGVIGDLLGEEGTLGFVGMLPGLPAAIQTPVSNLSASSAAGP